MGIIRQFHARGLPIISKLQNKNEKSNLDFFCIFSVELLQFFIETFIFIVDIVDRGIRIKHTTTMEFLTAFSSKY